MSTRTNVTKTSPDKRTINHGNNRSRGKQTKGTTDYMGNKIGASLCGQVTFVRVPIIGLGAFDKLHKCLPGQICPGHMSLDKCLASMKYPLWTNFKCDCFIYCKRKFEPHKDSNSTQTVFFNKYCIFSDTEKRCTKTSRAVVNYICGQLYNIKSLLHWSSLFALMPLHPQPNHSIEYFRNFRKYRHASRNMLWLGKYCKMIIQSILEIHGAHFGD